MKLAEPIAKHLRDFHFGGNWTDSNLKDQLADVTWEQATTKVYSLHSIAELVFHMNYFVGTMLKVLQGGPLDAHDKFSFDVPAIHSQDDWEKLLKKAWSEAERLACEIEVLPESRFWEDFADSKYGSVYRNINGVIEHCHYHLGQIVLIKKIVQSENDAS